MIASLRETFPGIDWERQAAYFFQRVIQHGRRRAEEMREAAVTVREAGLDPWSAAGTAERQAWVAELTDAALFGKTATSKPHKPRGRRADWRTAADLMAHGRSHGCVEAPLLHDQLAELPVEFFHDRL